LLTPLEYVDEAFATDGSVSVSVKDGGAAIPSLLQALGREDIAIVNLSLTRPTLDDVFLKHTGRTIREEEAGGDEFNRVMGQWMGVSRR